MLFSMLVFIDAFWPLLFGPSRSWANVFSKVLLINKEYDWAEPNSPFVRGPGLFACLLPNNPSLKPPPVLDMGYLRVHKDPFCRKIKSYRQGKSFLLARSVRPWIQI